jgi:hypothetical protein
LFFQCYSPVIPAVAPRRTTHHAVSDSFAELRKGLPEDFNVVRAGGWYNVKCLSADPKAELVRLIVDGLKSDNKRGKVQTELSEEKVEALVALLQSTKKGFESEKVEGDWALVFSRQGRKSPKLQKAVGRREKAGLSMNRFNTDALTFDGDVKLLRNKFVLKTTVRVR